MWDLWWTNWRWGRFSPSTWVSLANLHSTNCSINIIIVVVIIIIIIIIIIIWGCYIRPVVAAVPSELSLTPLRMTKKKYPVLLLKFHEITEPITF
jgi:hypothetical protein